MIRTVTAIKVRQNLGQVLNEAYYRGDEFVVERSGKPVAAIISIAEFDQWRKGKESFFGAIRKIQARNKRASEAQISKEVSRAVKEARQKRAA